MSAKTAERKEASRRVAGVAGEGRTRAAKRSGARLKPLTVGIVGAGRLGTAIGRALAACGHNVVAVVARQSKHAKRAASLIDTRPRALTNAQLEALPPVDLLFITTPDDAIAETAARLAAFKRTDGSNRPVALHMSGGTSSAALAPLRECGFYIGSMHPLASISEPLSGAENLRSAFYCLEGDRKAVSTARRLVRELGGKSFSIETSDKALYHAAAVISCNHLVALFDLAVELLARCHISKSDALAVLIPLLRNTCENIASRGTQRALTGPFVRADVATVRRHLSALEAQNPSEEVAVYTLLGRRSLRLAQESGADAARLSEIALELDRADGKTGKSLT